MGKEFLFENAYLGFTNNCKKRNPKCEGTIRISGTCPSKINGNYFE